MTAKGQILDFFAEVAGAIIFSLIAAGVTKIIFSELNTFFLFLGYLFLVCGILFNLTGTIHLSYKGVVVSGIAAGVFFILSWLIPNLPKFPNP